MGGGALSLKVSPIIETLGTTFETDILSKTHLCNGQKFTIELLQNGWAMKSVNRSILTLSFNIVSPARFDTLSLRIQSVWVKTRKGILHLDLNAFVLPVLGAVVCWSCSPA